MASKFEPDTEIGEKEGFRSGTSSAQTKTGIKACADSGERRRDFDPISIWIWIKNRNCIDMQKKIH